MQRIRTTVNDANHEWETVAGDSLLDVLRRQGYFGAKRGCDTGDCGACTILMEGRAVLSCLMFAGQADGRSFITIEGLSSESILDPLQAAFVNDGAIQCGFCTPGMVMSIKALLEEHPCPTEDQIRDALTGNLCRCTGYVKVVEAVLNTVRTDSNRSRKGK